MRLPYCLPLLEVPCSQSSEIRFCRVILILFWMQLMHFPFVELHALHKPCSLVGVQMLLHHHHVALWCCEIHKDSNLYHSMLAASISSAGDYPQFCFMIFFSLLKYQSVSIHLNHIYAAHLAVFWNSFKTIKKTCQHPPHSLFQNLMYDLFHAIAHCYVLFM